MEKIHVKIPKWCGMFEPNNGIDGCWPLMSGILEIRQCDHCKFRLAIPVTTEYMREIHINQHFIRRHLSDQKGRDFRAQRDQFFFDFQGRERAE
jgi:hypothetical protein